MVEVPGARVPESGETEITSLQRGVVFVFHLVGERVGYTIHMPGKNVLIIVTIQVEDHYIILTMTIKSQDFHMNNYSSTSVYGSTKLYLNVMCSLEVLEIKTIFLETEKVGTTPKLIASLDRTAS